MGVRTAGRSGDVTRTRPPHLRPRYVLLLALGGAVGTAVRAALESAFPAPSGTWPWTTFGINLLGALVLGALLEALALTGPDTGWRRVLRLGGGTGVIGGFTTYSTFGVESDLLLAGDHLGVGVGYGVGSIVLGALAALAGMALAGRVARTVSGRRA